MLQIRFAILDDMKYLNKYDSHISCEELKISIDLNRVYVAYENQKFIGWLRYHLFWDNTPFMNMLYLLEDGRGKGYGRQLVQFWEGQMKTRNYTMVMTSTAADEYAQHFYHKLGYTTIGGFMLTDSPYELILSKKI